jgi:hypothetical protein
VFFVLRIRETVDGEKVEGIPVEPAETSAALKDQDFLQKAQSGKPNLNIIRVCLLRLNWFVAFWKGPWNEARTCCGSFPKQRLACHSSDKFAATRARSPRFFATVTLELFLYPRAATESTLCTFAGNAAASPPPRALISRHARPTFLFNCFHTSAF